MTCDEIRAALAEFSTCEITPAGARIPTHCLYPSHEPVHVYVVKHGSTGFIVHDGGEAARIADLHGRDEVIQDKALRFAARRYDLQLIEGHLRVDINSVDWLSAAILTVANAAAQAAYKAVEIEAKFTEARMAGIVYDQLVNVVGRGRVSKEVTLPGRSGRSYRFDFAVAVSADRVLPIDLVGAHHNSVASKFVAFSDTFALSEARGLAAHHDELRQADQNLLSEVATLVPVRAVEANMRRIMAH